MKKERKVIYQALFFLIITLPFFQSCSKDSKTISKPNIILIVADDQGWGDLGINGNSYVNTPTIDELAKKSAQFTRFYVSPVCSPTRAEILTGRYHPRGGVYDTSAGGERLDLDEITLADILKSNGYSTAVFGKWHSGSQPPYHPNNRGFDEFYGFASGHWGNYINPMLEKNGEVVKGNGFIIDDLTDHALNYIETKNDQPFFVLLAYNTPHSPMQVPDFWWDKYKNINIDTAHRYGDKEFTEKTKAALALSENIDWNVGKVISKLDSLSLIENTIIIYMSDNGPNGWRWNDGLKGIKGSTDEGGVRSPFIVYWKDKIIPKTVDYIASTIDILPSVLDLAGITTNHKKPLDGTSLKPLLFNENQSWPERYVFSHWNGNVSVRNQQFILDQNNQLFDLSKDPGQLEPIFEPSDSLISGLLNAKKEYTENVLKELDRDRKEVFPVGFEGSKITQLPARDGIAHGNIQRSNRFPNSSFFTNWISTSDSITFDSDILAEGDFKATIYYTCKSSAVGSTFYLKQRDNKVSTTITEANDPPYEGVEFDRFPRQESYEKDFKPLEMGIIHLDKGHHPISLHASEIKGSELLDFRLLVLERIK
ncbi:arylsulfatase [Algoriphagus sp.]|uniref:arylsulfatase n=1 Tax=Algoriphagus sp. TaxID=1872435 RepID=UPI0025F70DB9|nr:arylsulfatase [Algoriphagus sp.]